MAPSPPSEVPRASAKRQNWGPYLGFDFCVLRRCAVTQEAQQQQQQRQQPRAHRRLPAAGEAARPGRRSGRARVAAHALGAQPGPERGARGSPLARTGSPHASRKLATLPGCSPGGRTADLPVLVPARAAQVPSANSHARGEAGRADPGPRSRPAGERAAAGSRSRGARGPAPESKRNS